LFYCNFLAIISHLSSGVLRKNTLFCEENRHLTRSTPEETVKNGGLSGQE